ncbi:iron uptake porin [Pannus brasiliensis CCIBt3594]|uniref:Iron uptake porin n=1 Tax=Pannus brasiliensis CCIBt3594 TaxID=1427578 RepID=A0AAW9QYK0_9CHRO
MLKVFWKSLLVSPAILGATLAASANASGLDGVSNAQNLSTEFDPAAIAQVETTNTANKDLLNQIETYGNEGQVAPVNGNSIDQVTSVNQLRDVSPTAWAYEALRSLVERYGCIVGYPDRTFRGDRAMTRWEFAAGLNACLNVMERLIQEGVGVLKEDIDKLKRLADEFQAELAALGARVDNLESRVSFLEDHQFSTTTKLTGEVIFAVTDAFGSNRGQQQAVFQDRVRLLLNTSFTGQDVLKTRLSAGSAVPFGYDYATTTTLQDGTPSQVRFNNLQSPSLYQTWTAAGNNNDIVLDWLAYYTPIDLGSFGRFNTYVAAWGGIWNDFVPTTNPYFEDFDGGNGSLSTFSQENPIYRIGGGSGAGASLQLGFLQSLLGPTSFSFGYLGGGNCPNNSCAGNPNPGNGLFNGDYAALAQINTNLFNVLNIGFTYVNAYQGPDTALFGNGGSNGVTGSSAANLSASQLNTIGSLSPDTTNGALQDNVSFFNWGNKSINAYGVSGAVNLGFASVSAFGTYASVRLIGQGDADVWTYGGGIAFPDVMGQGNILGFFAGVQPYIGGLNFNESGVNVVNNLYPIQVEAFYKYQVTNNISLTPGVIWISAPEQFKGATNAWIGTLRTTFTF